MRVLFLAIMMACTQPATADSPTQKAAALAPNTAEAIFAGGCFWCMEPPFDKVGYPPLKDVRDAR